MNLCIKCHEDVEGKSPSDENFPAYFNPINDDLLCERCYKQDPDDIPEGFQEVLVW